MDIKKLLLPAAPVWVALSLVAPSASAATPEADPLFGATITAVAASGESALSTASGMTISCSSGSGTVQSSGKTTGSAAYVLHGCKETATIFKFSCTSEGQPAGTVKLATATGHLVYLDENHTRPGVLATPPENGVFAKFSCAGGFSSVEVKGNGILGEVTAPACGQTSSASTVVTQTSSHGVQKTRQIEETGTVYNLTASINGGPFESVGTTWSVTATATGGNEATLTCPEQK
jgi:hypothetical protein